MEVIFFKTKDGKSPFLDWFYRLKDPKAVKQIEKRIDRLQMGHMGDCKKIQGTKSILELRIHVNPGYRLYCVNQGNTLIIMLCGGSKSTQNQDIKKAEEYWDDYNSQ